jgi:hypothetical protein
MYHRRFVPTAISILLLTLAAHAQTYIFGGGTFPSAAGHSPLQWATSTGTASQIWRSATQSTAPFPSCWGDRTALSLRPVTYATGLGPLAIVTGDGNLDPAVTDGDCVPTKYVAWTAVSRRSASCWATEMARLGRISTTTGTQPSSLATGDFNGDGSPI